MQEKVTLPYGTGATCAAGDTRCFTSYERSTAAGTDYAVNRTYHFTHGRFMHVDSLEMAATKPLNPQSLNLYAYVNSDPLNHTDPSGLLDVEDESVFYLNGGDWWGSPSWEPMRRPSGGEEIIVIGRGMSREQVAYQLGDYLRSDRSRYGSPGDGNQGGNAPQSKKTPCSPKDIAAAKVLREIRDNPRYSDHANPDIEYPGNIYQQADGSLHVTEPVAFYTGSYAIPIYFPLGTLVGTYHSHPHDGSSGFSTAATESLLGRGDLGSANRMNDRFPGFESYLLDAQDKLLKYNPSTGKTQSIEPCR